MNRESSQNPAALVLEIIREVQTQKRAARQLPRHALVVRDNLYGRVKDVLTLDGFWQVLKSLESEGRVELGRTINDDCVSVLENSNSDGRV